MMRDLDNKNENLRFERNLRNYS